jgi:hypothetical protein
MAKTYQPRFSNSYRPELYVHRYPVESDLIELLTKLSLDSKDQRNIFLEAVGDTGKSWLMDYIISQCEDHPLRPVILDVSLKDFKIRVHHRKVDQILVAIAHKLWVSIQNTYPDVAKSLPPPGDNVNEVQSYLNWIGSRLCYLSEPIVILIFIDGAEEIIDYGNKNFRDRVSGSGKNIFHRLEDIVIEPLHKNINVRIVSSRRNNTARWLSYKLKRAKVLSLPPFVEDGASSYGLPMEQLDLLMYKKSTINFAALAKELPYYNWNHPGTNALLFKYALNKGVDFPLGHLDDCFAILLRSAISKDLATQEREWLERILSSHKPAAQEPIAQEYRFSLPGINDILKVEDTVRNKFLSDLQANGIGTIKFPYFDIRPEVAAIFFELQRRKTP